MSVYSNENYIKIASVGDNLLERSDPTVYFNSTIISSIEKIKNFIKENSSFTSEGNEYIQRLLIRLDENRFFLRKAKARNPDFSATWCVKINDHQGLNLLVRNEEDVNQQDDRGFTAMHFAVARKRIECIKILLEYHKTDISIKAHSGKTAQNMTMDPEIQALFALGRSGEKV